MNITEMNTDQLKTIFASIGLASQNGMDYKERMHKHRQIFDFLQHLEKAVKKLSTKRTLTLVDCACGKSYLSFVANYYFTHILNRKVQFIGIDYDPHVIEQSKRAARQLGFVNMTFVCNDIFKVSLAKRPDLVYSLHACNTATDMTIAKGILEGAHYIMTVSCCQHYMRNSMKKHPLGPITKHGVYKERLADMLADTMRSLVLEMYGYQPKVFDYVPASETPKNVMIRSVKGDLVERKTQLAQSEYNHLKNLFHTEPKLMEYIQHAQEITMQSPILETRVV